VARVDRVLEPLRPARAAAHLVEEEESGLVLLEAWWRVVNDIARRNALHGKAIVREIEIGDVGGRDSEPVNEVISDLKKKDRLADLPRPNHHRGSSLVAGDVLQELAVHLSANRKSQGNTGYWITPRGVHVMEQIRERHRNVYSGTRILHCNVVTCLAEGCRSGRCLS